MQVKSLFWLAPFGSFFVGYQLLSFIYTTTQFAVPTLVGLPLNTATMVASDNNLNLRILTEKLDDDLPNNTVLSQSPFEQNVRPNQSIFIVISKKPTYKPVPNLWGKKLSSAEDALSAMKFRLRPYFLYSDLPKNNCMCQDPAPEQIAKDGKVIAYFSAGSRSLVIMPNMISLPLLQVQTFLQEHNIAIDISYRASKDYLPGFVIDQKPVVGTIIDLGKIKRVQLEISE